MVKRSPGTTLTETLVVMAVFSTLMILILGFYIEGSRVTARQEQSSGSYRRVLQVLDRVETLLAFSRVYYVQADQVVFSLLPDASPLALGFPDWGTQARTLAVKREPPALLLCEDGTSRVFLELSAEDEVCFGWPCPGVLEVTASSRPTLQPGQGVPRTVQATRKILLENDEER
jgi:type II secretory pathway pseudopilin PulG